jgi:hypothetical protein
MKKLYATPAASTSLPFVGLLPPSLRVLAMAILALVTLLPTSPASPPTHSHIVIVESDGAAGKIDRQRLDRIADQVCNELHIAESTVPQMIFIHLTKKEAEASGVPSNTPVMIERSFLSLEWLNDARPARFFIWIVGKVDDPMLVGAVAHVLRQHLQLSLSDQDLLLAEKRILDRLKATVDVDSFVKSRK